MNSKRRAELQRKLTLNAVPRPPAGLAERIKADIPKYLEAESTASRFTRSIQFNLRIAASIVVLATSVVVAMMMVQRNPEQMAAKSAHPVIFPPASRAMPTTDTTTTTQMARTEEVNLDIVQEAPPIPRIASGRVAPPATVPERRFAEEVAEDDRAQSDLETSVDRVDASGVAGGVVGGTAEAQPAQPQMAEAAAPPPEDYVAEPVPAPAPAPVMQDAPLADARRERAASPKFATAPAAMAPPPVAPPPAETSMQAKAEAKKDSFFGISVSSQAFNDIRTTLESGRRPAASAVNVEALVNYFAGAPEKRPRAVRLEVEASPAALPAPGDHAVLRFTVDTPAGTGLAATDARIEVIFDDAAVAHAERVGDGDPLARESALPNGTSVTGLYELELKPGLHSSQLVATVRLHYNLNGVPKTIPKIVQGRDVGGSWQRASRRHRLATLGALWGESLKGTAAGMEVARRAEELATQEPDDVRARELARAANASAAGGR